VLVVVAVPRSPSQVIIGGSLRDLKCETQLTPPNLRRSAHGHTMPCSES